MVQDPRVALHSRLPLPPGPLADNLALWLQGRLLAGNGCLDRVATVLAAGGGNVHTLRRRLCDPALADNHAVIIHRLRYSGRGAITT